MALSDAGGPNHQHVVVALDEGAGREFEDLGLGDRGIEGEVEVLDGLRVLEVRAPDALHELLRLAPLHLVGEQPVEEFREGEVVVDGLLGAQLERLQDAGEAQLLEHRDEIVSCAHGSSPCR